MGQQLRVRIKRKRRVAYLRRKNAARRAAATRSSPNQTTGTERIRSVGVIDIINPRFSEVMHLQCHRRSRLSGFAPLAGKPLKR